MQGTIIGPLIGGSIYSVSIFPGLPNNGHMMGPMLVIAGFSLISVPLMVLYFWLKAERDQVEAIAKWEKNQAKLGSPVAPVEVEMADTEAKAAIVN